MYVDERPGPYVQMDNFDGENVVCTGNGWLKDQDQHYSTTESEFWRNAGPSAFQLQETMLKSDKL